VILGGAANEVGHYLADRRERKKAIARALADLLEIRLRFIGTELVIKEIGKIVPLTALDQMQARAAFNQLIGGWPQLAQRYNDSVPVVASVAPILAYQLRSKEIGQQVVQVVDAAVAGSSQPKEAAVLHSIWQSKLSPLLSKGISETLTKTCRRVAWKHGIVSWVKVKLLFRRTAELGPEEKQYLAIVTEMMEQQKNEQQQPTTTRRMRGTRTTCQQRKKTNRFQAPISCLEIGLSKFIDIG
jgi:hypothetical protein